MFGGGAQTYRLQAGQAVWGTRTIEESTLTGMKKNCHFVFGGGPVACPWVARSKMKVRSFGGDDRGEKETKRPDPSNCGGAI